jgi:hypothetical protein
VAEVDKISEIEVVSASERAPASFGYIPCARLEMDSMFRALSTLVLSLTVISSLFAAPPVDRDTKVRNDRAEVTESGFWIYDDLDKGLALAKQTGKPLLVVVRCIPCDSCEGFDARVVDRDPEIGDLLNKFVCLRIVKGNGLDLSLFQFDYDLSFAAFFMNADKTIYGRFGTRTKGEDKASEITIEGFRKALATALDWHAQYPLNKAGFAAKTGPQARFKTPEEYPSLKVKYTSELDYEGKVAQSCIHCHQVRDAHRRVLREANEPLPEEVLYPFPMPDVVGLKLNPSELATVKEVAADSQAAKAGFKAGDKILSLAGQPMLSIADVQWVLQSSQAPAKLVAKIERAGQPRELTLELAQHWRRADDISWRPTSWELRRMATGGLKLDPLDAETRQKLGLANDKLALHVKHVGQYGEHAAAKNAGFLKDDILVRFDGSDTPLTETDIFRIGMNEHRRGDKIPVTVLRSGKEVQLKMPLQ